MPTHEQEPTRIDGEWVNSGAMLVISIQVTAIGLILWWPASVNICEGFIALVALSFVVFLFGVARERRQRNILLVFAFVISNIASIILAFGSIYRQLGLIDSLKRDDDLPSLWDGIYFSIITLTTVGYGDVTPNPETRAIAAFEALTGYVIMGLLISVLIIMAQRTGKGGH